MFQWYRIFDVSKSMHIIFVFNSKVSELTRYTAGGVEPEDSQRLVAQSADLLRRNFEHHNSATKFNRHTDQTGTIEVYSFFLFVSGFTFCTTFHV